jgi:hypothetical protein
VAVVTGKQVKRLSYDGSAAMMAVYVVRNVTTGDTLDLGVDGIGDFLNVKQAAMIGSTVAGSAVATVSGTVITIPSGVSGDAIYLMAWGDSAI